MWSCSFCVFRVFSSGPYPFRNNLLKGHCKTFFFCWPSGVNPLLCSCANYCSDQLDLMCCLVCLISSQMANLAHRASQFMDKKFLIIHPTADGKKTIEFFQFFKIFSSVWHFVLCLVMFPLSRKSPLPTHSEIHQPAHQWKGQLHLTGTWRSFHSGVITAAADPISALVFSSPPVQFLLQPLGALWSQWDPTAGGGLAPHNAFNPRNEITGPSRES